MGAISADALLQANAAMIVGAVFLVNLRKAQKKDITREFMEDFRAPIITFCISALFVMLFDVYWPSPLVWTFAEILFMGALFGLIYMVYRMTSMETIKENPEPAQVRNPSSDSNSTSQMAAAKAEAIHQVDSVFGILLVVLILWTNISISVVQRYAPQNTLGFSVWMGLFVTLCILIGLHGILRQSWRSKIYAWWTTLASLLFQITFMALLFVAEYAKVQLPHWAIPAALVFACLVSFPLNNLLVTYAYYTRLEAVSCPDSKLEMTAFLWAQFFLFFIVPTVAVGAVLLYYLT